MFLDNCKELKTRKKTPPPKNTTKPSRAGISTQYFSILRVRKKKYEPSPVFCIQVPNHLQNTMTALVFAISLPIKLETKFSAPRRQYANEITPIFQTFFLERFQTETFCCKCQLLDSKVGICMKGLEEPSSLVRWCWNSSSTASLKGYQCFLPFHSIHFPHFLFFFIMIDETKSMRP